MQNEQYKDYVLVRTEKNSTLDVWVKLPPSGH